MNILITNDDGIYADGIIELAKEISNIGCSSFKKLIINNSYGNINI